MTGYNLYLLKDLIEELGEDKTEEILSSFSCPLNSDVENFLKYTAILFDKQHLSSTHLVFASYKQEHQLAGYFTLAQKSFLISNSRKSHTTKISNTLMKKLAKYGTYDNQSGRHTIPAPLIAQLGRNFSCGDGNQKLISGDELLKIACDKVWEFQRVFSGRHVYLECEDKPKLINFYESNGFVQFGTRPLDADEKDISGEYLVQMLKDLKATYSTKASPSTTEKAAPIYKKRTKFL